MNPAQAMNLGQLLTQTARLFPERTALIHGASVWSWKEMEERVAAAAAGLLKGDRILLHSRNNVQMFELRSVAFPPRTTGCRVADSRSRLQARLAQAAR